MGLESATWVTQFDATFPQSSDPRSQGDDHLRLIKSVLQQELSAANRQWVYSGHTPTRVSGTAFTVTGDESGTYEAGRRIKVTGSTTGTIYGTITSSTYSTTTAVNIDFDSGSMANEALSSFVSSLTYTNHSLPKVWLDVVNVKDFGATGDGATDDATAINNAIAYVAGLTNVKTIYFPAGTYVCGAVIDLSNNHGLRLVGDGVDATILQASHSAGAVVQMQGRFQRLEFMTISASAGRSAGAAGSNYGILLQPPDVANNNMHDASLNNVRVADQPSHGIAFVSHMFGVRVESFRVEDNKGHGVIIDNGTLTSMVNNIVRPGSIEFYNGHVNDNTGHAFKVGDDDGTTNIPLRIRIQNVDTFRNALYAGVRKSAHAWWLYTENSVISQSAMGCGNSGSASPTVSALYLAGRDNWVDRPRFINPDQPPVNLSSIAVDGITSRGNKITDLMVSGMSASAAPVVVIDTSAFENVVIANRITEIQTVATPSTRSEWERGEDHYIHRNLFVNNFRSGQQRTVADDGFTSIEFDADPTFGMALISGNTETAEYALLHFRVGTSPTCSIITGSADVTATAGIALAGTTGDDAKLTISAHTDKKLYIENRTAASRTYNITLLGVGGGDVLPAEMEATS